MRDYYYWVMMTRQGQIFAVGPYKSREAAETRMSKTTGGEAAVMQSFTKDARQALDEYKAGVVR